MEHRATSTRGRLQRTAWPRGTESVPDAVAALERVGFSMAPRPATQPLQHFVALLFTHVRKRVWTKIGTASSFERESMKIALLLASAALLFHPFAPSKTAGSIARAQFASSIKDREPADSLATAGTDKTRSSLLHRFREVCRAVR